MVALASSCRFSFSADALGRRVGRDDGTDDVVYFQNGQQTFADYVSGASASSPTYTYVYGSYIDEPVYRNGTGGMRYYHRNGQYSVTALTNASGTITERYSYTAYGQPAFFDGSGTAISASAESNRMMYTGREWDDDLDLYHYRARMYDAVGGRFLGRDPIGYLDGYSLYLSYFVPGMVDPMGLQRRGPLGGTPIDLPATPAKCDLVNGQLNRWAVGHNQTYLDHWRGGSGTALESPFWHFDSSGSARSSAIDATLAKAKRGLACGATTSVTHSIPEPRRSNQTNPTVTPMIFGWRFWYSCTATVTKTCHTRPQSPCPCHEFAISVSCEFNAKDHINFWNSNIPFCTPEYCFTDQLVRACNPDGKGFDVTSSARRTIRRTEGCTAIGAITGGPIK